jgi:hypothetical protein
MLFTPTAGHDENLFGFIAQRWHAWKSRQDSLGGLEGCGAEMARVAHDLSLTTGELRSLARKGAGAADLLYRRMAAMALSRDVIVRAEPKVMQDMQKTCSLCESKKRCRHDFALGAESSAWRAYCPNDDTLSALASQTIGLPRGNGPARRSAVVADDDQRGRYATALGLLFIGLAWLVLLAAPPAGLRLDRGAITEPEAGNARAVPAVTCLDASCLSVEQLAAMQELKAIQAQGWLAATADQVASLPPASLLVQRVHASEALACTKLGGTTYYGMMFQDGCSRGGLGAARLSGFGECRPMSAGGACFLP